MNSKFLLFALLGLLVGFGACNETDEPDQPLISIPLVKTMIICCGNYTDSVHYEYDPAGRLIKASQSPNQYSKYTYTLGEILIESYINKTTPEQTTSISVNEKGVATSAKIGAYVSSLKYDSIGYLVLEKLDDDTLYYANISDGNTVKKKHFSQDKFTYTTKTYQFLTNNNTIGCENNGITWMGKQDKNLPSKETQVFTTHSLNRESITDFIYEYDAHNRVKKRTTIKDGEIYLIESYTYY